MIDRQTVLNEAGTAAAKMSPPVAVAAAHAAGWGPSEWMYVGMAIYAFLQAAHLAWKWLREWRTGREPA